MNAVQVLDVRRDTLHSGKAFPTLNVIDFVCTSGKGRPRAALSLVAASDRYGSCIDQALRPCVAACRIRALGTMVRPDTSTIGNPVPAAIQVEPPLGSFMTPKSEAA